MAEAARARMDEDGDLTLAQPVRGGRIRIEDALDPLHLDKVVAGAHRAELSRAPELGPLGDRRGIGTVEPPFGLRSLDVVGALGDDAGAVSQHRVEIDGLPTLLAGAGGDAA